MKTIFVTFQREGIHQYLAASHLPELQDVSFLQYPHRHVFHFRIEMQVFHDDRDVEFILLKRDLEKLIDSKSINHNFRSCEMIVEDFREYLVSKYGERFMKIEVSEDGENGAIGYYNEG